MVYVFSVFILFFDYIISKAFKIYLKFELAIDLTFKISVKNLLLHILAY